MANFVKPVFKSDNAVLKLFKSLSSYLLYIGIFICERQFLDILFAVLGIYCSSSWNQGSKAW